MLQGVLIGVGVLGPDGKQTPAFAQAWTDHRVDIMARAQFYCRAASDVAGGLGDLAANLPAFMDRAEKQTSNQERQGPLRTEGSELLARKCSSWFLMHFGW